MSKKRRDEAIKRGKRKKIIKMTVLISVITIIVALLVINAIQSSNDRIFTDGQQSIRLYQDGNFSAQMAHEIKKGTYTESVGDDGVTTISFVSDGVTANGSIVDNILTMPEEWDDGHGHGGTLRLK